MEMMLKIEVVEDCLLVISDGMVLLFIVFLAVYIHKVFALR